MNPMMTQPGMPPGAAMGSASGPEASPEQQPVREFKVCEYADGSVVVKGPDGDQPVASFEEAGQVIAAAGGGQAEEAAAFEKGANDVASSVSDRMGAY